MSHLRPRGVVGHRQVAAIRDLYTPVVDVVLAVVRIDVQNRCLTAGGLKRVDAGERVRFVQKRIRVCARPRHDFLLNYYLLFTINKTIKYVWMRRPISFEEVPDPQESALSGQQMPGLHEGG
jgi:hypothetical protein